MDLQIKHEVQSKDGRILYKVFRPGGRRHYKIRLSLAGSDLKNVKGVTYHLHKTFRKPDRTPAEDAEDYEIFIWTWGQFRLHATVIMKDGKKTTLKHDLFYSLPIDNGLNYLHLR